MEEISNAEIIDLVVNSVEAREEQNRCGMLIIKSANQWIREAALRPVPRDIYKGLIFENDLTILFASTGAGKSLFAVQIAHENSHRGKIIYLDCELSDMQFKSRYTSKSGKCFAFSENLIRIELSPDADLPAGVDSEEDYLMYSLEEAIIKTGARFIIVDNITYLRNDTEKAREALSLMKRLKRLKQKHNITILAIAHTPKRDETRPLSRNDMAGSMMLSNLADGIFAIGVCASDKSLRYVKQFKSRYTETLYDSDNVMVYQVEQGEDGFLGFTFLQYGNEDDYIRRSTSADKQELEQRVDALHALGRSIRQIAAELMISDSKVYRTINRVKQ